MRIVYTDVLVIGVGLAGLRAAVERRRRGHDVIIRRPGLPQALIRRRLRGTCKPAWSNATKGEGHEDIHFEDRAGLGWGCDQLVALFAHTAPGRAS